MPVPFEEHKVFLTYEERGCMMYDKNRDDVFAETKVSIRERRTEKRSEDRFERKVQTPSVPRQARHRWTEPAERHKGWGFVHGRISMKETESITTGNGGFRCMMIVRGLNI